MEPIWPSIGAAVCDFIEENLTHGPGPMKGQPVQLTNEEQNFIFQAYEVHPRGECGRTHCNCVRAEGSFRFEWAIYCRLKGARKSELAAWLAHCELYGPCRFGGWDDDGDPFAVSIWQLGGSADIPFAATAEDQVKDTAWASFYEIAKDCSYSGDLDIGLTKVSVKRNGAGNARVVTSSSIARDGGRPTFTVIEEPHLWVLPELIELNRVLDFNLGKLGLLDPHGVKVSTMFGAGESSVLESDYDAWKEDPESGILFDLRSARDNLNPKDDEDVLTGIRDAIGDAIWLDEHRLFRKFKKSRNAGVRYWWNKRSTSDKQAIDPDDWKDTTSTRGIVEGEQICLGFDGSLYDDCTALIVSCVSDGFQWPALIAYPDGTEEGVNALRSKVDLILFDLTTRFQVLRAYCDPPHWSDQIAHWQGTYGDKIFVSWWTNRDVPMTWATHRWAEGIETKTWFHQADEEFTRHVVNAQRRGTRVVVNAQDNIKGWVPTKDRPGSARKIDATVASILAHEARTDVIRAGVPKEKKRGTLFTY